MSRDEFEEKVIAFMARIDEHMANQSNRCDSHGADLRAIKADQVLIKEAINFSTSKDEPQIGTRVGGLEKFNDRVIWVAKAIVYLSSGAAAAYGTLSILVQSILPHSDKVVK